MRSSRGLWIRPGRRRWLKDAFSLMATIVASLRWHCLVNDEKRCEGAVSACVGAVPGPATASNGAWAWVRLPGAELSFGCVLAAPLSRSTKAKFSPCLRYPSVAKRGLLMSKGLACCSGAGEFQWRRVQASRSACRFLLCIFRFFRWVTRSQSLHIQTSGSDIAIALTFLSDRVSEQAEPPNRKNERATDTGTAWSPVRSRSFARSLPRTRFFDMVEGCGGPGRLGRCSVAGFDRRIAPKRGEEGSCQYGCLSTPCKVSRSQEPLIPWDPSKLYIED